jgi:Ser/Thr protein kinase RdoA (MazF antagonist)
MPELSEADLNEDDLNEAGLSEAELKAIAERFQLPAPVARIRPLGNGNVNRTYLVELEVAEPAAPSPAAPSPTAPSLAAPSPEAPFPVAGLSASDGPQAGANEPQAAMPLVRDRQPPQPPQALVLQALNTKVFSQPQLVMANMRRVTEHIQRRLAQQPPPLPQGRRWRTAQVLPALEGDDPWHENAAGFWRLTTFLEGCDSPERVSDADQAEEIGRALGTFHSLISDLPPEQLADTLEGFHVTPNYLLQYQRVLAEPKPRPELQADEPDGGELAWAQAFVRQREGIVDVLERARREGRLRLMPIHGDPKVNNVLLQRDSGQAVALIDLDTVKPGLIHYDLGDCLRSVANPLGEETRHWRQVCFEPGLAEALLRGYGAVARQMLSDDDVELVFDAVRLIAFELGLRFLTDHLAGDVYFRCESPGHNLRRALVQFQLTASIEAQEAAIRAAARAAMR